MNFDYERLFRLAWLAALSVATAVPAAAQDVKRGLQLEEIVVTAQKRVESLQDVPVSAQVISGAALTQQNQISLETLATTVPALHIAPAGPSHDMYIRGIGSGSNQSFDQSVGTFVDDIFHGRSRISAATFLDLERIEVLKGPQSTYFGNNAIAGALNIVSRKPKNSFDSSIRALYGEYGQYALEGVLGGPLSDKLSARVAAVANGLDGWIENVTTDEDAPKEDNYSGRLSLLFEPSESFDALLKVEYGKAHREGTGYAQPFQITNCPPPPPIPPQFAGPGCAEALAIGDPIGLDNDKNAGNAGMGSEYETGEGVLTLTYDGGGHTFTSVTGYYDYDYTLQHDGEGTSLLLFTRDLPESYHQFSQELRLASPADQRIEYMVGAYYQTDELNTDLTSNFFFVTPFFPPDDPLTPYLPLGLTYDFRQGEDVYSVFGSLTFHPNDRWTLGAGLRGSWVKKDFDLNVFYGTATKDYGGLVPLPPEIQSPTGYCGQGVPGTYSGDRSDDAWMPSARIQYQFAPQMMGYVSYSRGFKAGGFNGTEGSGDASTIPFDPEYVDAYEIGWKSEWLDNTLLTNLAAFLSDYHDLQVSFWDFPQGGGGAVPHIKNAAESRSQGVELEAQWIATESFRLSLNATLLDAHFVDYKRAAGTVLDQLNGQLQDLSGKPTQFSPDFSGNLTATYSKLLGSGRRFTVELNPYFTTGYHVIFLIDKDFFWQDDYVRLDGRVGFEGIDGRWSLDLIGKNLTDETILTAFGSPYQASTEAPRNFAVQFRYRW